MIHYQTINILKFWKHLSYVLIDAFLTRQKTHCAPDHTKHPLHRHLHVLLNLVVGGRVKVDVEYLQHIVILGVA